MKHISVHRVILPTDDLIDDFSPTNMTLTLAGLDLKEMVSYLVDLCVTEPMFDHGTMSSYIEVEIMDLIDQQMGSMSEEDRRILRYLLMKLGNHARFEILPLLNGLNLNENQFQALRCVGWLHNSLIVEFHMAVR